MVCGRSWRRIQVMGIVLVTIHPACDAGEGPRGPVVRDSAGITIVENSKPQWSEERAWHVVRDPTLDIGTVEGPPEYEFFGVGGAVVMTNGTVVVSNAGTNELRFFDATGHFLRATGRKGGGPGEFESLGLVSRTRADSLLAYDFRLRRISVLDGEGSFVRSFPLQVLTQSGGFATYIAPFPDGSVLLVAEMTFASGELREGTRRDSAVYYRLDSRGSPIDTIGAFPGGESYTKTVGDGVLGGGLVFGRFAQRVVSGDGFYYGSADAYEIGYHAGDGRLQRLVRLPQPNLKVTPDDIETYTSDRLARAPNARRRQIYEQSFADMPFPDEMAAYGSFHVDADGNLWVAETRRPGDDQPQWKVFDPQGVWLGTVETPTRFAVYQIGSDFLLGRWRDESDVEHIRIYPLSKPLGSL